MLTEYAKKQILLKPRYRQRCAAIGALLNHAGYALIVVSRKLVRFMNHHVTHEASDWFVHDLPKLHAKVRDILIRQRVDYGKYYYFYGYPYQALAILGIYGERSTEERFDAYELGTLVTANDRVFDLGTNCGFVALYTALRTGCYAEGIDINPYMIEIGNECAKYLRIHDRVKLHATKIQDFTLEKPYSIVFSFATHWTDDENYRVPLREHFERCASYLEKGGRLLFETHSADVGNAEFYAAIETFDDLFTLESKRDTDRGTRHLYLFRKN